MTIESKCRRIVELFNKAAEARLSGVCVYLGGAGYSAPFQALRVIVDWENRSLSDDLDKVIVVPERAHASLEILKGKTNDEFRVMLWPITGVGETVDAAVTDLLDNLCKKIASSVDLARKEAKDRIVAADEAMRALESEVP